MNTFKKHEVEWNKDKINRFWDYFVENKSIENQSYAKEVAPQLVKLLKKYIHKTGNNLDYGCGGGNLMSELFRNKIQCSGIDASEDSIKLLKSRFDKQPLFKGALVANDLPHQELNDNNYDFIFSLEMLEHLMPETLDNILIEFNRILKPGGYVFISVPNKENREKYKVICPDCGCIFHRVQHINTFNKDNLENLLIKSGFDTIFIKEALLTKDKGIRGVVKKIISVFYKNEFFPHLIYLGKKK